MEQIHEAVAEVTDQQLEGQIFDLAFTLQWYKDTFLIPVSAPDIDQIQAAVNAHMWSEMDGDESDDEDDGLCYYWTIVFPNPDHENLRHQMSQPARSHDGTEQRNDDGSVMNVGEETRANIKDVLSRVRKCGLIINKYVAQDGDEIMARIRNGLRSRRPSYRSWSRARQAGCLLSGRRRGQGPPSWSHACWKKLESTYVPFDINHSNNYLGLYGL